MKKYKFYSVAIPLFSILELLIPSSAFTEVVITFAILLMVEILCVEYLPLTEEEKVKLKVNYDSAISSNDKISAMKSHRKLNSCGLKEAKSHVDSALAESANVAFAIGEIKDGMAVGWDGVASEDEAIKWAYERSISNNGVHCIMVGESEEDENGYVKYIVIGGSFYRSHDL